MRAGDSLHEGDPEKHSATFSQVHFCIQSRLQSTGEMHRLFYWFDALQYPRYTVGQIMMKVLELRPISLPLAALSNIYSLEHSAQNASRLWRA